MRILTYLLTACILIATFQCSGQNKSKAAWLQSITANAINKPTAANSFLPAKPGLALYYSAAGGENVPYLVYVPEGYNPSTPTPVVVFLHGAILARENYQHEDPAIADEPVFTAGKANKAIVVFPFGRSGFTWPSQQAANNNVISMLKQVKERYNVNNNKVYLGGISMGGAGTYWFINNRADNFSGFFTFSAIPHDLDLSKITKDRPLYSMYAKDDAGCPYSEVSGYYEANKNKAASWHITTVETGGHRFIYAPDGKQHVSAVIGKLLK
jgi:predicted peptidase